MIRRALHDFLAGRKLPAQDRGCFKAPTPARGAGMDLPFLPPLWQDLAAGLASCLHQRHAWRLAVLLLGALFAKGRRTVTRWLRAAGVGLGCAAY